MSDATASSPSELPYDAVAHLRADGVGLLRIVTDHGLEHPVPSCPGWNLGDLAWHLGNVWNRYGRTVSEGITTADGVQAIGQPERPTDDLLLDWVTAAHTSVLSALTSAGSDAEVWTWTGRNQPVAWVQRRVSHETAVHRWDAAAAVGVPYDVPTAMAADGIDEFLMWFAARNVSEGAAPVGGSVHLHCTDIDSPTDSPTSSPTGSPTDSGAEEKSENGSAANGEWLVSRLDESGIEFTREHSKGDAAVRGTANDLLLWLWRREAGPVEILGDAAVAERFRAFPAL